MIWQTISICVVFRTRLDFAQVLTAAMVFTPVGLAMVRLEMVRCVRLLPGPSFSILQKRWVGFRASISDSRVMRSWMLWKRFNSLLAGKKKSSCRCLLKESLRHAVRNSLTMRRRASVLAATLTPVPMPIPLSSARALEI